MLSSAALYAPKRNAASETFLEVFLRRYAETRGREFDSSAPPLVLATDINTRQNPTTVERDIDDNRDPGDAFSLDQTGQRRNQRRRKIIDAEIT